jgi:hypothetical protein
MPFDEFLSLREFAMGREGQEDGAKMRGCLVLSEGALKQVELN